MSVNDITGDTIRTDVPSEKFKNGWETIWGNKVVKEPDEKTSIMFLKIHSDIESISERACAAFQRLGSSMKHTDDKLLTSCASHQDGDCHHKQCPQLRDNEPKTKGRSCPLYDWNDDE